MKFFKLLPTHDHLTHPKYRPDIDGLRAVAVLAVVCFHAFPFWLKGGFIGVDIFFIISGFLISTIIFDNLERGSFSFVEFYSRRINRIFPALLLVLIACLGFGWFALLADEYKQLGKHVAAGAGFVSNFVFWNESGYFDNDAETKPLLHLWTLGIEEQFYIIWPLLLWTAWKGRFNLLTLTLIIATISFALNIKGLHSDAIATFYSPQTRFWELLIGSILAHVTLYKPNLWATNTQKLNTYLNAIIYNKSAQANENTLRNVQSILGAALIGAGLLIITKERPFPGTWALLPTLGAVLIISAGSQAWLNRVLLSNRILVWFGLISFPLYLWHWPLLSFARIVESETPSRNIRIAAVVISIALAWLTYKFIEQPIRFSKFGNVKTLVLAVLMIIVGSIGYYTYKTDGFLSKRNKEYITLSNYNYFDNKSEAEFWGDGCFNVDPNKDVSFLKKSKCDQISFEGRPKIFLIGDSHSAYLSQYLRGYLNDHKYNLFQYSAAYCTPLSILDKHERCRDINNYVFKRISEEQPDFVIIFAYYSLWPGMSDYYGETASYDEFIKEKTIELKELGVKHIIVIGHIPTWNKSLPHVLLKQFTTKNKQIPLRTYDGVNKNSLEWDSKMSKIDWPDGVNYLSPRQLLCNDDGCLTTVGKNLEDDLIVFDYGHLTKSGAKFITEQLLTSFLQ